MKDIIQEVIEAKKAKQTFKCKFCEREFRRENSLLVHICEPQRRLEQRNEVGVRIGYHAWLRFFELSQGSAKKKTYEDFIASQYYNAFIKFGRHIVDIRAINSDDLIDYVIKEKVKLDNWCKDSVYAKYLTQQIKRENPNEAMERSIATMIEWADEVKAPYKHYFFYCNANIICNKIEQGRISPWVLYNCDSGIAFLEGLNDDQVNVIFARIDPDFWNQKFVNYLADSEYCKKLLKEAGL